MTLSMLRCVQSIKIWGTVSGAWEVNREIIHCSLRLEFHHEQGKFDRCRKFLSGGVSSPESHSWPMEPNHHRHGNYSADGADGHLWRYQQQGSRPCGHD